MIIEEESFKKVLMNCKIGTKKKYRLECFVIENYNKSYQREKSYIRNIEVYYLAKKEANDQFQILVTEFKFSNDDNAMGKLIKQLSYLFDELILTIDVDGNIVSIDNLGFLRLRWIKIRTKLSSLHQGNAVENYFNQMSTILENEESLIEFLQEYKMFGLLFNGLWTISEGKRERKTKEGYTEIMTSTKKGEKIIQTITAKDLEQSDVTYFKGINFINKGNFVESFVEIKKREYHLKHSLLWIG